jgi:adenosyl cobinamide kinase/adenosyl cobinamide phosphate guanylyltransferase
MKEEWDHFIFRPSQQIIFQTHTHTHSDLLIIIVKITEIFVIVPEEIGKALIPAKQRERKRLLKKTYH